MAKDKKVRVLVVDDSALMRKIITSGISADGTIEVIGSAEDPFDARDKILELEPDAITLDINMPKMNGIEFLKKLLPQYPVPVIVVSSQSSTVKMALEIGAAGFVSKPASNEHLEAFTKELTAKIKSAVSPESGKYLAAKANDNSKAKLSKYVIAIGASTGGTEATATVLNGLKNDLPPILIVQHMPPGFTKMYAERLNSQSSMEIREAKDGDRVLPGRVIIAAGEHHMKLVREGGELRIRSYKGEKVSSHCPSVDVLFESVAQVQKGNALGIILTGMGSDGAKGLLSMRNQGAHTIGQDEKSSVVYGMPKVSFDIGAVAEQCSVKDIPRAIYRWAENI